MRTPWATIHLSERASHFAQSHPRMDFGYILIRRVIARQGSAQIGLSAAGVAFWFIIALFPALIATLALLGVFLQPEQLDSIVARVNELSPGSFGAAVLQQVQVGAQNSPSTVSWALIISLSVSAWSASSGIYNLSRGLRLAYALPPRVYLLARLRAFGGSYLLIVCLATITIATTTTSAYVTSLESFWRPIGFLALAILAFTLLIGVMMGIFTYAIGGNNSHLPRLVGAVIASIGLMGVYVGLGVALNFTVRYQSVYGALAGTVVVMLVLYVASYVMLIGGLVNGQWQPTRQVIADRTPQDAGATSTSTSTSPTP